MRSRLKSVRVPAPGRRCPDAPVPPRRGRGPRGRPRAQRCRRRDDEPGDALHHLLGTPPTSVATMGRPADIASRDAFGQPSGSEIRANTSSGEEGTESATRPPIPPARPSRVHEAPPHSPKSRARHRRRSAARRAAAGGRLARASSSSCSFLSGRGERESRGQRAISHGRDCESAPSTRGTPFGITCTGAPSVRRARSASPPYSRSRPRVARRSRRPSGRGARPRSLEVALERVEVHLPGLTSKIGTSRSASASSTLCWAIAFQKRTAAGGAVEAREGADRRGGVATAGGGGHEHVDAGGVESAPARRRIPGLLFEHRRATGTPRRQSDEQPARARLRAAGREVVGHEEQAAPRAARGAATARGYSRA